MSGRGKGGRGLGWDGPDGWRAARRIALRHANQQRCEQHTQATAEREHRLAAVRGQPRTGVFVRLLSDLLLHTCSWLDTASLVALRGVCTSWAAISRQPRAWVSSSWVCHNGFQQRDEKTRDFEPFDAWARLQQICASAPHLRALMLPCWAVWDGKVRVDVRGVSALAQLEQLSFRCLPLDSALLTALPSLRHVERREVRIDSNADTVFEADELTTLCALSQLRSFIGHDVMGQPSLLARLSQSASAAQSLTIVRLLGGGSEMIGCSVRAEQMARFAVLEELTLESDGRGDGEAYPPHDARLLSSLAAAPALRLLSLPSLQRLDDAALDALLARPAALARLEYLRLGGAVQCSLRKMQQLLAGACALRVLYCDDATCGQPLTKEQWQELGGGGGGGGEDRLSAASLPADASPLFLALLLSPPSVRTRLLTLGFSRSNSVLAQAQLLRRLPAVSFIFIHRHFNGRHPEDFEESREAMFARAAQAVQDGAATDIDAAASSKHSKGKRRRRSKAPIPSSSPSTAAASASSAAAAAGSCKRRRCDSAQAGGLDETEEEEVSAKNENEADRSVDEFEFDSEEEEDELGMAWLPQEPLPADMQRQWEQQPSRTHQQRSLALAAVRHSPFQLLRALKRRWCLPLCASERAPDLRDVCFPSNDVPYVSMNEDD
jgi:hypothetical protein